jgi:hypothetical protein
MKFWQIIIYLFLLPLSLKAQGEEWPFSIQKKLSSEEILSDSLKYKLIEIISDKSNNDSLRVDAVRLLARLKCDTCISFLIEHINDRFNYGTGDSETDQATEIACWSALLTVGKDYNFRWHLFQLCITALHMSERDDLSLELLLGVLNQVISREELKNTLIEERRKNNANYFSASPSKIYEINIDKLLIILNQ